MGLTAAPTPTMWKENLADALAHHEAWWNQRGLVLWVTAPKDRPWEDVPEPTEPASLEDWWFNPQRCAHQAAYDLSRTHFGGDALPLGRVWKAAGDLAPMLGSPVELARHTVWMHPCLNDDNLDAPLRFDPSHAYVQKLLALTRRMKEVGAGRFFVTLPDLVENIDILANLRGTENLMLDMIERPEWVTDKLWEINAAFAEAFEFYYREVHDERGGNTFVFNLWGPGRTAKVQCDACSMFGPDMFGRFVAPALEEQCRKLDYAMFHLDGETCLPNLEALLEVRSLRAVEWTPMSVYRDHCGGHPRFYDLYKRILSAGKSVQAIGVRPEDVIPLLDAVGPRGLFITTQTESEEQARQLEERVRAYR